MSTSTKAPSVLGTVIATTLVAVLCLALYLQLVVLAPRFEMIYEKLGPQVSWLSSTVRQFGSWAVKYWFATLPAYLYLLRLLVLGIIGWRHLLRSTALLPVAILLAGLVAANVTVAFALFQPVVTMNADVSK